MSNKQPAKRRDQVFQKIAILSNEMIDAIEELELDQLPINQEFLKSLKIVDEKCRGILEQSFKLKGIISTTYLNDMSKRFDTVIRKNYIPINE